MLNLNFWRNPATSKNSIHAIRPKNLAQVPGGRQAIISGYGKLAPAQKQHLQAYGLLPGRTVRILAQRPVTIILIEQTELAFESTIASQVFVE